jgi:hypothetical protein
MYSSTDFGSGTGIFILVPCEKYQFHDLILVRNGDGDPRRFDSDPDLSFIRKWEKN